MINLDFTLVASVAVIFLLLMWVLNVMLFKPILAHIDGRNKTISDGLSNVDQNSKEIADLEAEASRILEEAKKEAASIRHTAVDNAKAEASKKLEAKQKDVDYEFSGFEKKLEEERVNLKNTLLGQAPLFKESLKAKFVTASNE